MTPGRRRLAFAGSVAGAAIVALDGTFLTIAQPTLQRTWARPSRRSSGSAPAI